MAKEFYSASEVNELLNDAKNQMIESINSAVTMSTSSSTPTKYSGDGLHVKVLRKERK